MKKIILIVALPSVMSCKTKKVSVECTILSHQTTSDKYGFIGYYTLINCVDGEIRSKNGVDFYAVPVGNKIVYSYDVYK